MRKQLRIGIIGYAGRMGQAIAGEIAANEACMLAGGVILEGQTAPAVAGAIISSKADDVIAVSDVVIDFTLAEAVPGNAKLVAAHKKPYVCGVTGLSAEGMEAIKSAAAKIPALYASNTSVSLVAMKQITALAAKLLADFDYDVSILDEHHRMKKDAPSGTAKTLGEAVLRGNAGKKTPSYAAIRAGAIVGEHEVDFVGQGEIIRLRHSVTDRRIFARGAVQAAVWLHGKPAGFYGMEDVIGL
jgi:4-hydroxy-tetrahydrodipicolinate reductase